MLKFKIIIIVFIIITNFINVFAQKQSIKIGAGSLLGSDYNTALELCKFIEYANKNVKCEVIPAKSSVQNLALLQEGAIDLSLVHANIAIQAFNATGYYKSSEPMRNISQVLRLHDKTFTVIVKDDDKIKVLADINGKKISKGSDISDGYLVYEALSRLYAFEEQPININLHHENYAQEFCNGNAEAMILMAGHPNALVNHIAHHCEIDFVSIEDDKIKHFLKQYPEFHKTVLKKGLYPGITENQNSFSVPVLLLTTDKIDPELLTRFMRYFIKNFVKFKNSQPLLHNLDYNNIQNEFIPLNNITRKIIGNNAINNKNS
jgi:TRAP transporter TAXI family solute receptor